MDKEQRQWDLSVSTYGVARRCQYDIALLPWGATEPHNLHLPYLTDCILSHDIAVDAAAKCFHDYGKRCMVMPPVPMGAQNPGQRDLPFCVHYRYETQKAILADLVDNLQHQGLRKLVIVNGHGGNNFKNMIRDLTVDHPDFMIATGEWFRMADVKAFFDQPGDHADEVETSVMMHYHPEYVDLGEAGPGQGRSFRLEALRDHAIWMPRNWGMISPDDTGVGDPRLATAEKGRRFAEAVVERYALFLRDLADIERENDLYV